MLVASIISVHALNKLINVVSFPGIKCRCFSFRVCGVVVGVGDRSGGMRPAKSSNTRFVSLSGNPVHFHLSTYLCKFCVK